MHERKKTHVTIRARSSDAQWWVWTGVALFELAIGVIVLRVGYGVTCWSLFDPIQHRVLLIGLAVFTLVAYLTRWDGVARPKRAPVRPKRGHQFRPMRPPQEPEPPPPVATPVPVSAPPEPEPPPSPPSEPEVDLTLPGELEYSQARAMVHQPIPDYAYDDAYLELLGQAVAKGYARAFFKLGQYAMRRGTLVEGYYWMWMARWHGMPRLDAVLRDIRSTWAMASFPTENWNVHKLFNHEAGSVGRALLNIDSGHDAFPARAFLRASHPELLKPREQTEGES